MGNARELISREEFTSPEEIQPRKGEGRNFAAVIREPLLLHNIGWGIMSKHMASKEGHLFCVRNGVNQNIHH